MTKFDFRALPWNIVFETDGIDRLPGELEELGLHRALVLTTSNRAGQGATLLEKLGNRGAGLFARAVMHVPMTTVEEALATARELDADCTVSLGGGSTTGLGKALALEAGLPNIAIPTTYAGSEMTSIWGITENGRKVTGRDPRVVPTLTIYDPRLTLSLPASVAGPSGLNAMAQAAVNVTSGGLNPIVTLMALEAVRALARSLPRVIGEPENLEARAEALYGACLAGAALGAGTTGLHHRLCHTLGGSFNTPHAETHSILLPHCIAYNATAAAQETAQVAQALGVENAALGVQQLARTLGAPTSLQEIGIEEADLDRAAAIATESTIKNPEPVTTERVRDLLVNAWQGSAPAPIS